MNTVTSSAPQGAATGPSLGQLSDKRPTSLLRYAKLTDPAALFVWVLFTSGLTAGWGAPIRYLCVAYFAAGMIVFAKDTMPAYLRGWPTMILPSMAIISTIWAPSSGEAFRQGILLALTGVIAIYAASRLTVRQIVACYYLGEIFGAVMSVLQPNIQNGNWTGIFGQKNFMAIHMFIFFTCGFVLMLDKNSNKWLRGSTLVFVPLSVLLIWMSHSATTILMVGGTAIALLGHAFIWQPAARVAHMRTLIISFVVLLGLAAGLLLFGLLQFDAMDTVLAAFGKDSTLTGRTFIWDWGHRLMNEHPWTGLGANGFWRSEVGVANQITTYFHYEQFVKFSFHNSYIENGVQYGYPGYYATYFIVAWGLWNCGLNWLRNQTLLNAGMLILGIMVVVRSNTEIDLAAELAGTAILLFIGAIRKEDLRPQAQAPAQQQAAPVQMHTGGRRGR